MDFSDESEYRQTIDYLLEKLPMFQRIGPAAFKKGLDNIIKLCDYLDNPQRKYKTIHVAGTNGKGSTSHMLASILQHAGYTTGLHTSPHLKEFTERSRVNGKEMSKAYVVEFVKKHKHKIEEVQPSFFEISVAMGFAWFAEMKVDIAVIEVGMGGRLDSTNIIQPILCHITRIDYDHTQFLGDTLPLIAAEKAGIIKENVPVIITTTQSETSSVFNKTALEKNAPIYYADAELEAHNVSYMHGELSMDIVEHGMPRFEKLTLDLSGIYQLVNVLGVIKGADELKKIGYKITDEIIRDGLRKAALQTGLKGRWQVLGQKPLIICDTGHNEDGIRQIVTQIASITYKRLFVVFGMVNDKDISKVLTLLPKQAFYIFTQANIPRAMDASILSKQAHEYGIEGKIVKDVNEAFAEAKKMAQGDDMIFIGGSTFVVAEINEL